MDDHTFDSFVRSFAAGKSRRSILKGLLGLAGAAGGGQVLAGGDASAARRPTPTPKPVRCPGSQIWDGSACVCTSGTTCGPECCPEGVAECCDNACCYGACMGEEQCCPTAQYCPGATRAGDLCCASGTHCCDAGTDANTCAEQCALPCAAGSEPDGVGGCTACPPGTASSDGLACVPCVEGSYAAGTGNATCVACECRGECDAITGACQCSAVGETCETNADCCRGFCSEDLGSGTSSCYCIPDNNGYACQSDLDCCEGPCTVFPGIPGGVCGTCLPTSFFSPCSSAADCCDGICTTFSSYGSLCLACLPEGRNCTTDAECCGGLCENRLGIPQCYAAP